MKFLKTFLFTISFLFIFGSILSLCGYCEALPELVPDSNGFSVIEGSGLQYYDWSMPITEMYFMNNPFVIDDVYDSMDSWLKNNTGYDIEHSYQMGIDGTVLVDGGGFDVATANWLADRFSRGTLTATQIASNGYRIFSHSAQQWGANAKEWFLGKIDSVSGKITNVTNNVVTKITAEGLVNYQSMLNNQLSSGTLNDLSSGNSFKSKSFALNYNMNTSYYDYFKCTANFQFSDSIIFYSGSSISNYNRYTLYVLVPKSILDFSSSNPKLNCNGVFVYSSTPSPVAYCEVINPTTVTVNNIDYCYGYLVACNSNGGWISRVDSDIPFGDLNQALSLIGSNGSIANGLQISSSSQSLLNDLLSQLVGKYVDNNILSQINDIIKTSPIVIQTVDNKAIPVAEPSSSQLDDIEDLIQQAIDNSLLYESLLSPYDEPIPEPEPEPVPNNQGTEVPEDFSTDIYVPIVDSIDSTFSFISIFEPLFYLFSFSTGLLALWFVVPFVLLFLVLFRMLK